MATTLSAENVSKRFATRGDDLVVLRDVTLSVDRGEAVAIMGPSGSGKSTLLNILGTLDPPSDGRLRLADADPFALSERDLARFRNQNIGFVFQDHHLLPQLSVLENVLIPALADPACPSRLARGRELIERVGLTDRIEHRPAELSGGERQRVAIARALINEPSILLADEPTGNLDRVTADSVADLLVSMPRDEGVALVVVTHSQRLAGRLGSVYELLEGSLGRVSGD